MDETKQGPTPKTKQELFAENPDDFIDVDNIVICIVRSANGPAILCRPVNRQEAIMAKGECDIALMKNIMANEMGAPKVTTVHAPSMGIIGAARNRLFKGRK